MTDVITTFYNGTWRGACRRPSFPEYRLVKALEHADGIERVLVSQHSRSRLRAFGAAVLRRDAREQLADGTGLHTMGERPSAPTAKDAQRWAQRYEGSLRRSARLRRLVRPAILTADPVLAAWGDFGWAGSITYFAWDDWAAHYNFAEAATTTAAAYDRIAERGIPVAAVSQPLLDRIGGAGPRMVVPNAVAAEEWELTIGAPDWFEALPRPRVLYVGALDQRLDIAGLLGAAERRRDASFVLAGPLRDPGPFASLFDAPNVFRRPSVSREEVVGLTMASDATMIPHRDSALTRSMSPLKLYEGLAGGCSVAVTDLPPMHGVDPRVKIATDVPFHAAVEDALTTGRADEAARLAFVRANDWPTRLAPLISAIERHWAA